MFENECLATYKINLVFNSGYRLRCTTVKPMLRCWCTTSLPLKVSMTLKTGLKVFMSIILLHDKAQTLHFFCDTCYDFVVVDINSYFQKNLNDIMI